MNRKPSGDGEAVQKKITAGTTAIPRWEDEEAVFPKPTGLDHPSEDGTIK